MIRLLVGAEAVALARGVFAEKIAIVRCRQIRMIRPGQIVDLSELLGKVLADVIIVRHADGALARQTDAAR